MKPLWTDLGKWEKYAMELKDRVAIINDKNIGRLLNLYGEIKSVDELSKIVNNHLSVAIDEIEEDETTCALKGLNVMNLGSVLAHGTAISTQEALADVTPINWSDDVMDGQYKNETIIKAKTEEKDMTKELSIESIKKELMDALVGDMRIITSFGNKEKRRATDYIGTNIFNYLDDSVDNICHIDAYINFDVMKLRDHYDVFIQLKAHKDITYRNNKHVNLLDEISKYIEEIVSELYPYYSLYADVPGGCIDRCLRRNIRFSLYNNDAEKYQKSLEDKASA